MIRYINQDGNETLATSEEFHEAHQTATQKGFKRSVAREFHKGKPIKMLHLTTDPTALIHPQRSNQP